MYWVKKSHAGKKTIVNREQGINFKVRKNIFIYNFFVENTYFFSIKKQRLSDIYAIKLQIIILIFNFDLSYSSLSKISTWASTKWKISYLSNNILHYKYNIFYNFNA